MIFGQQLYWIYTEGKSLTMKLGPDEIIAILKLSVRYDWFTITILAVVKSKWTVISIKYD